MCSSRTRKHLMGFLILAILLCEMCFFLQSADTSSFCVQTTQSTKHVTHAQISDGSKVVYEERISKTPDSTLFLQISNVTHNTSGHISLIQCVYLKDGKKR